MRTAAQTRVRMAFLDCQGLWWRLTANRDPESLASGVPDHSWGPAGRATLLQTAIGLALSCPGPLLATGSVGLGFGGCAQQSPGQPTREMESEGLGDF